MPRRNATLFTNGIRRQAVLGCSKLQAHALKLTAERVLLIAGPHASLAEELVEAISKCKARTACTR